MNKFLLLFLILTLLEPIVATANEISFDEAMIGINGDFSYLKRLKFNGASNSFVTVFGGTKSDNIVKFYEQRVFGYEWSSDLKTAVMAQAAPFGNIIIGPKLFSSDIPQIFRISILLHEARHEEAGRWLHQLCAKDYSVELNQKVFKMEELSKATVPSCDDSDLGAYGIAYIFLRNVVDYCDNCDKQTIYEARVYSDTALLPHITGIARQTLIAGSNQYPSAAEEEAASALSNFTKSQDSLRDWLKSCLKSKTCLRK